MKAIYVRAVMAGLTGILIMLVLFSFCVFMADHDMKEYYKIPRGYDNDFVGMVWIFLFIGGALFTFTVIGALSAWATSSHAASIKDTIFASFVAGSVPITLVTIGIVGYVASQAMNDPRGAISALIYALFASLQYLILVIVCLSLSIVGGLFYSMVGKRLLGRKARGAGISYDRPIKAGLAGAIVVLLIFLAGLAISRGEYSMSLNFMELLLFLIISIIAGALAVRMLKAPDIGIADAIKASLAAGALAGVGGTIGNVLGAVIRQYNVTGILLESGVKYLVNGMIMAAIGGILYVAIAGKSKTMATDRAVTDAKTQYWNAVKLGLMAGLTLAVLSTLQGLEYMLPALLGTGAGVFVSLCKIIGGFPSLLIMLAILVAATVLSIRPAGTLDRVMAISAVVGAISGLVSIIGDVVNRFLMVWFINYSQFDFHTPDLITSNLASVLDCTPLKILVFVAVCVISGILYGVYLQRLKYADDPNANGPTGEERR